MAYNGAGTFSRLYNWATDKANSIKIRADRMDAEMDGFATGLSTAITKDGQTTVTANIPFATYRLTGVGNGTALQDAATVLQVQNRTVSYAATSGTDTYTATLTPTMTALVTGQMLALNVGNANATTTPTLAIDATAARTITKYGTDALAAGDIPAGMIGIFANDGTRWQLLNPKATAEDQGILASQIFA